MAFDFKKEHVILSIGGIVATATIAYLIYKAEKRDNDSNTQAELNAQSAQIAEEQQLVQQVSSISVPAISSTTTSTSSGDIATASSNNGASAEDPILASLIAAFQSNVTSVPLQTTPVAQIQPLPEPTPVNILPNYGVTTSNPTNVPSNNYLLARTGIGSLVSQGQ